MTREKAIKIMQINRDGVANMSRSEDRTKTLAAFDMAIKALEQEPCENAISRQAALDAFGLSEKTRKYGGDQSGYDTMMLYEIQQTLEDLPPVNPQPKTGHWIDTGSGQKCSECGEIQYGYDNYRFYCANCGTKMVEP